MKPNNKISQINFQRLNANAFHRCAWRFLTYKILDLCHVDNTNHHWNIIKMSPINILQTFCVGVILTLSLRENILFILFRSFWCMVGSFSVGFSFLNCQNAYRELFQFIFSTARHSIFYSYNSFPFKYIL